MNNPINLGYCLGCGTPVCYMALRTGFEEGLCPDCYTGCRAHLIFMNSKLNQTNPNVCFGCGNTLEWLPVYVTNKWKKCEQIRLVSLVRAGFPHGCMPPHISVSICKGNAACYFEALLRPVEDSRLAHPMYQTCNKKNCFVCKDYFHFQRWHYTGVIEPHLPLIATPTGIFIVDREM